MCAAATRWCARRGWHGWCVWFACVGPPNHHPPTRPPAARPAGQMIEETKRSLHDALCVARNLVRDNRIVYGGGAAEIACALAGAGGVKRGRVGVLGTALGLAPDPLPPTHPPPTPCLQSRPRRVRWLGWSNMPCARLPTRSRWCRCRSRRTAACPPSSLSQRCGLMAAATRCLQRTGLWPALPLADPPCAPPRASQVKSRQMQEGNPYLGVDCNDVGTNDMREQHVFETLMGKRQQLTLATQVCKMILKIDDVIKPSEYA